MIYNERLIIQILQQRMFDGKTETFRERGKDELEMQTGSQLSIPEHQGDLLKTERRNCSPEIEGTVIHVVVKHLL